MDLLLNLLVLLHLDPRGFDRQLPHRKDVAALLLFDLRVDLLLLGIRQVVELQLLVVGGELGLWSWSSSARCFDISARALVFLPPLVL